MRRIEDGFPPTHFHGPRKIVFEISNLVWLLTSSKSM
jgi:hypothetical protein